MQLQLTHTLQLNAEVLHLISFIATWMAVFEEWYQMHFGHLKILSLSP